MRCVIKECVICFSWILLRQPYLTDKLLDLPAVGSVTSLRQGREGATLHFLLAGLFVFALEVKTIIHICATKVVCNVRSSQF